MSLSFEPPPVVVEKEPVKWNDEVYQLPKVVDIYSDAKTKQTFFDDTYHAIQTNNFNPNVKTQTKIDLFCSRFGPLGPLMYTQAQEILRPFYDPMKNNSGVHVDFLHPDVFDFRELRLLSYDGKNFPGFSKGWNPETHQQYYPGDALPDHIRESARVLTARVRINPDALMAKRNGYPVIRSKDIQVAIYLYADCHDDEEDDAKIDALPPWMTLCLLWKPQQLISTITLFDGGRIPDIGIPVSALHGFIDTSSLHTKLQAYYLDCVFEVLAKLMYDAYMGPDRPNVMSMDMVTYFRQEDYDASIGRTTSLPIHTFYLQFMSRLFTFPRMEHYYPVDVPKLFYNNLSLRIQNILNGHSTSTSTTTTVANAAATTTTPTLTFPPPPGPAKETKAEAHARILQIRDAAMQMERMHIMGLYATVRMLFSTATITTTKADTTITTTATRGNATSTEDKPRNIFILFCFTFLDEPFLCRTENSRLSIGKFSGERKMFVFFSHQTFITVHDCMATTTSSSPCANKRHVYHGQRHKRKEIVNHQLAHIILSPQS